MQLDFHPAKSRGKRRPRSFFHQCRRDSQSRQPDRVQTRYADYRKKVRRETLQAQREGAIFFSWRYKGGEKGGGEGQYENHQVHKAAKEELENSEEPALTVNVPD